ncbi:hypothetical protein B0H66DRAFT_313654 [Apodospora peruviana]|uniref:NAD(P)-binding protein n=1 Tax=Apodospora peruviana TaxID=516989 RepID=A0AAE0M0E0_9PEZI|nr:hypothetical protein B0H66DRAFT_313654 [Apodospora peruviana]
MTQQLVWLVTGSTGGSGLALVRTISARGDLVIATGRNISSRLSSLPSENPNIYLLDLDVVSPLEDIKSVIASAVAIHGRIDVLINNAGMSRMSSLEEGSEEFVKTIFDVNLFGSIKVAQAVLPHMRSRKTGTVAFIGAGLGWIAMPFLSHYSLTKASLTMFAEALQHEISPLGLRSIIFEPGGFDSDLATPRNDGFGGPPKIEDYQPVFGSVFGAASGIPKSAMAPSDIAKIPDAIIDVIKGEGLAKGRTMPLRVVLGPDSMDGIRQKCKEQLELLDEWEDVTLSVMKEGHRETSRWLLDNVSILPKS